MQQSNGATQQSAPTTGRSRKAVSVIGIAGLTGGLVLGGTMVATAANPAGFATNLTECTGNTAAIVPATPFFRTTVVAKANTVRGTVPAPTAAQLNGLNASNVRVKLTTQYDSVQSGGFGKSDRATVTGAGGQFSNPIGGKPGLPPVFNEAFLPANATSEFSVRTTGKAAARLTVEAFFADATRSTNTVVLGNTCPTGSTASGNLQGLQNPAPPAPSNATATPGGTVGGTQAAPPNNGAVTVNFTAPATNNSGRPILGYEVVVRDLTVPSDSSARFYDTRPDGSSPSPVVVGDLNTTRSYSFTVRSFTNNGESADSNETGPVTPAPATPGPATASSSQSVNPVAVRK